MVEALAILFCVLSAWVGLKLAQFLGRPTPKPENLYHFPERKTLDAAMDAGPWAKDFTRRGER